VHRRLPPTVVDDLGLAAGLPEALVEAGAGTR
jgi:hypothetical protein